MQVVPQLLGQYSSSDNGAAIGIIVALGVFYVAIIIFFVWVWWRIFAKAGYSGAMALLMIVPLVNLIMILILAFGEWPIQRELNHYRSMSQGAYPPGFAPQMQQQQYPRQ